MFAVVEMELMRTVIATCFPFQGRSAGRNTDENIIYMLENILDM